MTIRTVAAAVTLRQREFGVRLALGATRAHILASVLAQSGAPLAIGLAIGLLAGRAASNTLASLLFQVQPGDLSIYVVVAAIVISTSVAAALLPARHAASLDPAVTLRRE